MAEDDVKGLIQLYSYESLPAARLVREVHTVSSIFCYKMISILTTDVTTGAVYPGNSVLSTQRRTGFGQNAALRLLRQTWQSQLALDGRSVHGI